MQALGLHPLVMQVEQYQGPSRLADPGRNLKRASQFLPLQGWFPHSAVEHAEVGPSSGGRAAGWLLGRVAHLAGTALFEDQSAIARAKTAHPPRQIAVVLERR